MNGYVGAVDIPAQLSFAPPSDKRTLRSSERSKRQASSVDRRLEEVLSGGIMFGLLYRRGSSHFPAS